MDIVHTLSIGSGGVADAFSGPTAVSAAHDDHVKVLVDNLANQRPLILAGRRGRGSITMRAVAKNGKHFHAGGQAVHLQQRLDDVPTLVDEVNEGGADEDLVARSMPNAYHTAELPRVLLLLRSWRGYWLPDDGRRGEEDRTWTGAGLMGSVLGVIPLLSGVISECDARMILFMLATPRGPKEVSPHTSN